MLLNFVGVMTEAKEITWRELDETNNESSYFMSYLGNYRGKDARVYALFKDLDDQKKYCVVLKGAL